LVRLVDCG